MLRKGWEWLAPLRQEVIFDAARPGADRQLGWYFAPTLHDRQDARFERLLREAILKSGRPIERMVQWPDEGEAESSIAERERRFAARVLGKCGYLLLWVNEDNFPKEDLRSWFITVRHVCGYLLVSLCAPEMFPAGLRYTRPAWLRFLDRKMLGKDAWGEPHRRDSLPETPVLLVSEAIGLLYSLRSLRKCIRAKNRESLLKSFPGLDESDQGIPDRVWPAMAVMHNAARTVERIIAWAVEAAGSLDDLPAEFGDAFDSMRAFVERLNRPGAGLRAARMLGAQTVAAAADARRDEIRQAAIAVWRRSTGIRTRDQLCKEVAKERAEAISRGEAADAYGWSPAAVKRAIAGLKLADRGDTAQT